MHKARQLVSLRVPLLSRLEWSSVVYCRATPACCYRMIESAGAPAAGAPLVIGARLGVVGNFTRARLHTHCLLYLSRPLLSRSLPILREYAV